GERRSSPTTPPAALRTGASRTSTCSPRRSAATATASRTTPTTGAASSAASESHGLPSRPAESEAVNHAPSRRAGNVGSMPPLSEPDTAEAEAFLLEMLLIYPVLGVQAFQKAEEQ